METIPQRLRSLRTKYGLTQGRLASYMGVSGVTVNRWEKGAVRPSPLALEKLELAERLGLEGLATDGEVQLPVSGAAPGDTSAPVELDFGGDAEDLRLVVE